MTVVYVQNRIFRKEQLLYIIYHHPYFANSSRLFTTKDCSTFGALIKIYVIPFHAIKGKPLPVWVKGALKTKTWSKLVDVGQMGLKNESHLLKLLVT